MFKILKKSFDIGLVTIGYPDAAPEIPVSFRGAPRFDFAHWRDARPAAAACPTGAISIRDAGDTREVTVDYGLCIFCGECREADARAVETTGEFELAMRDRRELAITAGYDLHADGTQRQLTSLRQGWTGRWTGAPGFWNGSVQQAIHQTLGGRSRSGKWMPVRAMAARWRSRR